MLIAGRCFEVKSLDTAGRIADFVLLNAVPILTGKERGCDQAGD